MSFRKNPAQQMSLFDSTYNLTEREKKALERSWAKVFSEDVFPYIDEQPLSDQSLSRFRRRCYDYEQTHGIDLYHDCVTGLAETTARMMGIDKRIRRMDSLMVEANIRKLSRMELIYTCISKLIRYIHKNGHDDMIGHMEHYYDPNDFNRVIYHRERETRNCSPVYALAHWQ